MRTKQNLICSWDEVPILFDIPLAAIILGRNVDYLKKLAREHRFPAFKMGDSWLIRKEDFIAYLDNLKANTHKEETPCDK